jgi:hypothetical protein
MNLPLWLQHVLIALAVAVSAWVVLNKHLPGTARRVRLGSALWLLREHRAPMLRKLGRRIAAPLSSAATTTCGGCNGCDSGGVKPERQSQPAAAP